MLLHSQSNTKKLKLLYIIIITLATVIIRISKTMFKV